MEIFAYHESFKKWVEIGNSGMFRPEMLLPMGLPEDINVAGFGLSLERLNLDIKICYKKQGKKLKNSEHSFNFRPTMIRYGISNIRELFGHKIDLNMVYNNPILRLS